VPKARDIGVDGTAWVCKHVYDCVLSFRSVMPSSELYVANDPANAKHAPLATKPQQADAESRDIIYTRPGTVETPRRACPRGA
jgi:hypothetical protein